MLFSSGEFIFLFLPVSLIGYQLLTNFGRNAMLCWLSASSLFFYGCWNPRYLILLLGSILMNYCFSRLINREKGSEASRSHWLIVAITSNLLLLMWFKYLFPLLNFFNRYNLTRHHFSEVVLPLGISFFTFTQIAYLIDLRQGVAARQGMIPYSVFVTFYPHLIAGPIIHPREIMPQLESDRLCGLRAENIALGLSWFIMGLVKKVLLADRISPGADLIYNHPSTYGMAGTWLGALCYALQLYFDFSGYSDMALGLARMFSIEFPFNFSSPYKAANIIDFWQRWHMTLTRYIGDFLYTPILSGLLNRRMGAGKSIGRQALRTAKGFLDMVFLPIMASMFLAGIWHGAGLQFIVFGILHGSYLVINHAWRIYTPKGHKFHKKLPLQFSVGLTFLAVLVGEVIFRARNFSEALYVLGSMVGLHGIGSFHTAIPVKSLLTLVIGFPIIWMLPNTQEILGQVKADDMHPSILLSKLKWRPTMAWSLGLMVLFCLSIIELNSTSSFLYFQF